MPPLSKAKRKSRILKAKRMHRPSKTERKLRKEHDLMRKYWREKSQGTGPSAADKHKFGDYVEREILKNHMDLDPTAKLNINTIKELEEKALRKHKIRDTAEKETLNEFNDLDPTAKLNINTIKGLEKNAWHKALLKRIGEEGLDKRQKSGGSKNMRRTRRKNTKKRKTKKSRVGRKTRNN